jgi:site-specific DNA-methyltransferase (adenine-specific)
MPDYIDLDLIISEELNFPEEVMRPIRESIAEQGLHHPLLVAVVGPSHDWDQDSNPPKYKLIAGKKRFLALQQLKTKEAPVKIYPSNLTSDQTFEISLHENLKRWNLPWYEQAETELLLHELRQKQHGKSKRGGGSHSYKQDKGWSQADTAKELGIAVGMLSEDLDLARAVAVNPSLKNVKDRNTAMRLIRVQARRENSEAFALIESEFEMNQVFLGDSLEILKQLPKEIFDCCITDPPWSSYKDETLTAVQSDLTPIWREVFRTLKNDSFLYLITSSIDFIHYMKILPEIGFKVQDYPLIWQKTRTITHGRRNWEYARDYEPIIVAVKGSPVLTQVTEISAILEYKNLHYTRLIHPNEKPIELLKQLITNSTYEGNSDFRLFCWLRSHLASCKELKRNYIGIEKEHKFIKEL